MVLATLGIGSLAVAVTENETVTVTVNPYIGLETTAPTAITLTPTTAEDTGEATSVATVNSNNKGGYTLKVQMSTDPSNLVSGSDTIAPGGAADAVVGSLANNTWGFHGGLVTVYTAMPSSTGTAATLKTTSATATDDPTTTTFGAKVTNTQPTGNYSGIVVFAATTNP
jgi:hypothetical protein